MTTDVSAPPSSAPPVIPALERRLALSPQVALRPEPFGALAYHYGTRRLVFLRDHALVAVVAALADHPSAAAACDAVGVPIARRPSFAAAIDGLCAAGVLELADHDAPSGSHPAVVPAGAA